MGMHGHASSVLNTFVLMLVTPSTSAALVAVQRWWDGTTVEAPAAAAAVAVAATAAQALAGGIGLCVALRRRRDLFRCIHLQDEAVVAAVDRQHRHPVVKFFMFLWFALSQLVHEPWHWRLRHHLFASREGAGRAVSAAPAEPTRSRPQRQADHDDLTAACDTAESLLSFDAPPVDATGAVMGDSFSLPVAGRPSTASNAEKAREDAFAILRRVAIAQTLLPFVSEYKPAVAWFFVVEFTAQLLFAVASIAASLLEYSFPNPASRAPCLGQAIITAAVFGVYALLVVGLRPVLAPVMQHLTSLVAVVQFAAAIVGVCVSLKVVTSQAIIVVAVYAMTIAQMLPIGFFLIPWLWRSGRAVHDVLKNASAEDLLARLQNMQVLSRHRERERLAKATARAAKAAKAAPAPPPVSQPAAAAVPLEDDAAAVHKSFALDKARAGPPMPARDAPFDELEAALLLDVTAGLGPVVGSGGGVGVDLLSTQTTNKSTAFTAGAGAGAGGRSGPAAAGAASRAGTFLFDGPSAAEVTPAAAAHAHVSSTSWENANGPRGPNGESDLHRAFAAAARARISSRNPLARGNLVGDAALPSEGDAVSGPSSLPITPTDAEGLLDADETALALLLSSIEADGDLGTGP
jgi:hypothetical protein